MADSVVSLLLETLNQLLDQDADLLPEVEDELRSFHAELGLASGFIRNSVGQGNAGEVEVMAEEINKVAYRVEDDIDKLAVRIAKQRMRGEFRKIEEVDLLCFPDKMESLLKQLSNLDQRRAVISIVGEVGIGKTALAKKIYNESSVQGQFKYRAWVHVSRYCRAGDLLFGILESLQLITTGERQDMTDKELQEKLSKYLANRRYLIVLDDLRKLEAGWEEIIERAFPDDMDGSKILFTCRPEHETSLNHTDVHQRYLLEQLDKAERWRVLRERVFSAVTKKENLESLGKQMAEKCEGLPLSLAILGRLLVMQGDSVEAWSRLANTLDVSSGEGSKHNNDGQELHGSEILPSSPMEENLASNPHPPMEENFSSNQSIDLHLFLSFIHEHLPDHLSLCLLYFGMFPEGAEIPTKQLIQLWMAEGFIRQKGSRRMEDIGQQYLEELIGLNLIQATARRNDGRVKTCQIHDLIWKSCISKGREMKFLEVPDNSSDAPEKTGEKTRRVAIHGTFSSLKDVFSKLHNSKGVRSFHFSVPGDNVRLPTFKWNSLYEGFKLLRVLNLGMVEVLEIPKEVGRLIHLRYLRIRAPGIRHVPSSICNLLNLQTLDMRESSLSNLPDGIWKLQQLRHLNLFHLRSLPEHWGTEEKSLENLQTLSCMRPQKGMKHLMVRAKFPNINKLKLASQNPDETADFLESLDHLYHLQSLKIESPSKLPDPSAFPLTLTKITLQDTTLGDSCMKRLEKLPNLCILKLRKNSVSIKEITFNAGGFPQLQVLQMVELEITKWTQGGGAMVNLWHLVIKKCVQLTDFPNSLSSLRILEVILPTANLRKALQGYGCKGGLEMIINPPLDMYDESTMINPPQDESNASTKINPPQDVSDASAMINPPQNVSDASTTINPPQDVSDASTTINPPQDVSNAST
ncbi:hypothetical protein RGQ29_010072 [Quercus rubra]|uniref:Uncharacterized protein n=1 Tax=Quercus rubra TaxID=3512 RepID=A0AAN7FTH8_QUERU|nr:hypothetical protein RGQ29_010072 [Quercus rubra]